MNGIWHPHIIEKLKHAAQTLCYKNTRTFQLFSYRLAVSLMAVAKLHHH